MDLLTYVVAPSGRDADLLVDSLRHSGVHAVACPDLPALLTSPEAETIGPILITEEALSPHFVVVLRDFRSRQEAWSDPPIIVLTTGGRATLQSQRFERDRESLGDPVLLERPIRVETLLATVRAALRARQKQYQVREILVDRDRALTELRLERETLHSILESLPVGVLTANASGRIERSNRAAETIFRHPVLPTPDIAAHGDWIAFHPDGRRVLGPEFPLPRTIQSGRPISAEELLYQRGDGTRAWVSLSAAPVFDGEGRTVGGVVVVSDVDAQRKASEQLRSSEDRFRRLIETASVGVLIGDLQGGISYINPTLLRLLDYTAADVAAGSVRWSDLTPPEFADLDAKAVRELQEGGAAAPYEKVYLRRDGTRIPILVGAASIPSLGGAFEGNIAVFLTDLSQQKQAEGALIQSEKLAAVGRLAASISHEINNPLEAITNLLYLMGQEQLTSQAHTYLLLAEQELARVSQIAGQTLRFHRQATRARAVSPRELLEPVLALYQGRLNNSNIKVRLEDRNTQPVICFEGDIRQVLNNLVSNAIDAMRTGGTLTVRIRNAVSSPSGTTGVRISIADSGHGMPEATRQRIFEPFYTTKGINGTGLGLWISYGIVEKHGGSLDVRSSVHPDKHGTVFSLFLPNGALD